MFATTLNSPIRVEIIKCATLNFLLKLELL